MVTCGKYEHDVIGQVNVIYLTTDRPLRPYQVEYLQLFCMDNDLDYLVEAHAISNEEPLLQFILFQR